MCSRLTWATFVTINIARGVHGLAGLVQTRAPAGESAGSVSWKQIDFCRVVVTSNLGNLGPDFGAPAEIRYHEVLLDEAGVPIDLVIRNISEYYPHQSFRNNVNPCFALVNVAASSSVQLTFSLVRHGTNEIVPEARFRLTDWDLDEMSPNNGSESVHVFYGKDALLGYRGDTGNMTASAPHFKKSDPRVVLKRMVDFIERMFGRRAARQENAAAAIRGSSDSEVDDASALPYPFREVHGEGELHFPARHLHAQDVTPHLLEDVNTAEQKAKAVELFIQNLPHVRVELNVVGGHRGRNFLFTMEARNLRTTCSDQCLVWGDPHIITFDGHKHRQALHPDQEAFLRTRNWKQDQLSVSSQGVFWLVKSAEVHIQAMYENNVTNPAMTNMVELAVGGPFMQGNTLIFRTAQSVVTWNDEEILSALPSVFTKRSGSGFLISAKYHGRSTMVKNGKHGPGIDVELPHSVRLIVNRWEHNLAVSISMCAKGDQEGQCGNNNGDWRDDQADLLMARDHNSEDLVASGSSLFAQR